MAETKHKTDLAQNPLLLIGHFLAGACEVVFRDQRATGDYMFLIDQSIIYIKSSERILGRTRRVREQFLVACLPCMHPSGNRLTW